MTVAYFSWRNNYPDIAPIEMVLKSHLKQYFNKRIESAFIAFPLKGGSDVFPTSSVCDTCPSVSGSSSAVGGAASMLQRKSKPLTNRKAHSICGSQYMRNTQCWCLKPLSGCNVATDRCTLCNTVITLWGLWAGSVRHSKAGSSSGLSCWCLLLGWCQRWSSRTWWNTLSDWTGTVG